MTPDVQRVSTEEEGIPYAHKLASKPVMITGRLGGHLISHLSGRETRLYVSLLVAFYFAGRGAEQNHHLLSPKRAGRFQASAKRGRIDQQQHWNETLNKAVHGHTILIRTQVVGRWLPLPSHAEKIKTKTQQTQNSKTIDSVERLGQTQKHIEQNKAPDENASFHLAGYTPG